MKAGGAIITIGVVIGTAVGIGNAINPDPSGPAPAEAKPKPMMQRSWNTTFDGVTVSCGVVGDGRWQIMFPTLEEREEGAQPVIDRAPTDDVWEKACGPSDPGSKANSPVE